MKAFSRHFPYLEIEELIEYYCVFNGFENLDTLHSFENLLKNIEENILKKYDQLKTLFIFSDESKLQEDLEKLLFRISIGNRKIYSIYKNDIPQFRGSALYQILFSQGIITKEYSREEPFRTHPSNLIKKEFRKYHIEDKIKFSKEFYRFWFTFITPNKKLIEEESFTEVLEIITKDFDRYTSFSFETLSNELILHTFTPIIIESGSYWDRHIELDLLARTVDNRLIAGECKWKNHKISKNILNKLQKKCELANLQIEYFALFSKSGFSNELLKNTDENILLYDIKSFERLRDVR